MACCLQQLRLLAWCSLHPQRQLLGNSWRSDPPPVLQSLSVAEYSRQFFDRVLKGSYGETLEDNRRVAGDNFVCEHLPHMLCDLCSAIGAMLSSFRQPTAHTGLTSMIASLQQSWLTGMVQGMWSRARSFWGADSASCMHCHK